MTTDSELAAAWMVAMRRGDFARAWDISDQVLARRRGLLPDVRRPRHEQGVWDGRPFDARHVLVRCYHGLGDTIQCARFLPELGRRASRMTVWAQPVLLPLLATLRSAASLLPLHDGAPGVDYDVDLEIMELPYALRVSAGDLARGVPYFGVVPATRPSNRFSVGVVAGAGAWDGRRSIPGDLLSRLGRVPEVEFFNLQPERGIPWAADASCPDLLGVASRVLALDLVVTVDTMMAHLAGARGARTWTHLHAEPDWRWMEGRTDSPWYPTMRLFRQERAGEWEPVIEEVARELDEARRASPLPRE